MDDNLKTGDNRGEPRKPLKYHFTIFLSPSLKTIEQLGKTLPAPLPFLLGADRGQPLSPPANILLPSPRNVPEV